MIVQLDTYRGGNSNLRFIHKSVLIGEEDNEEYKVILLIENNNTGIKVPHPLTAFFSSYNKLKHSSIVKKANIVVPFLNYIFFENCKIYKLRSLSELEFQHGVDFLNDLGSERIKGKKVDRNTVISAESILKQFYIFLAEKELLNSISNEDFISKTYKNEYTGNVEFKKSPFKGVKYGKTINRNMLKSIPSELILAFIDLAILETPDIALGVYFQIFGGVRVSEVVNISKYGIELVGTNGSGGMIINIKRRYFRKDISNNNGKGGVKKERFQLIIPVMDILPYLFKKHIDKYHNKEGQEALFVNRDGNAMTEKSYRQRFNRLKKSFIKNLENHSNPDLRIYSLALRSKKWSSHIGRGTFSKLVGDYTKNPTELAVLRGDSTYEAVFTYLQGSFGVKEALNKVFSCFYKNLLN